MAQNRPQIRAIPLIAVVCALLLGGCGGDGGNDGPQGPAKPAARIPKVIDVGSEIPYVPFEFGKAPYQGFDVDVVNEISRRIHTRARFVNKPFDTIFRDLGQRKFDMVAAGAVITPEWEQKASFSKSYLPADLALVVSKGSSIRSKDDLGGKTVGAQRGSRGADYATNQTKARSVRTYALIDDALNALAAGQVDAVIHEYPISRYAARSRRDLAVVQTISTGNGYGFAFPKGSPLEPAVNDALDAMKRDGSYARIYRKWFRSAPPQGFAPASR